jgi:hypothetical protein
MAGGKTGAAAASTCPVLVTLRAHEPAVQAGLAKALAGLLRQCQADIADATYLS